MVEELKKLKVESCLLLDFKKEKKKDYRQDGGFVGIGRKEKADDVPARLSKKLNLYLQQTL